MIIGICEDKIEDRNQIQEICMDILQKMEIPYEMKLFSDGEEVLTYKENIDLLFLDIEMPKIDGIKVKEIFQEKSKNTMIIFVTVHNEMVFSAFGLQVYGFVKKEFLEKDMWEVVPSAFQILQSFVMIDGKIDSRHVIYIKAEQVYCKIVMENGSEWLLRVSMDRMEKQLLSVGFIRTHKSYLVNAKWMEKVREREVVTKCGTLPVSVRMRSKVKKQYETYCEQHARYC